MRITLLIALFVGILFTFNTDLAQAQDAPLAEDDLYSMHSDSTLTIALPGVLENDDPALNDSLLVRIIDAPLNGSVELQADGSFVYTPNAGFAGVDDFTYLIDTVPKQVLLVDTTTSQLKFNMKVTATGAGSARDSTEATVGGMASAFVNPDQGPFSSVHLYELNLAAVEQVDLAFRFGGLFVIGRLFVSADSGALQLNLSQRGEESEVIQGLFTQTGNKVSVSGTVNLDGTGLISPFIPPEPQELDTETDADIDGELTQVDTLLTLTVPVFLEEAFDLSGTEVEMIVSGNITGHGGIQLPLQSNLATVSITVDPLTNTSAEDELPFQYALSQNYPNPFNPVTTIAFSIPTGEYVSLKVYDTLGREVRSLIDGFTAPGSHEVLFEAGDLPSGMYIYRLETQGYNQSRKLVFLK